MNKFYLKILIVLTTSCILFGCQSLKDGLEGNKKSKSAEEFLIEKKNPLVLPPDFSKLPLPKEVAIDEVEKEGSAKITSADANIKNFPTGNFTIPPNTNNSES